MSKDCKDCCHAYLDPHTMTLGGKVTVVKKYRCLLQEFKPGCFSTVAAKGKACEKFETKS